RTIYLECARLALGVERRAADSKDSGKADRLHAYRPRRTILPRRQAYCLWLESFGYLGDLGQQQRWLQCRPVDLVWRLLLHSKSPLVAEWRGHLLRLQRRRKTQRI